MRIPQTSSKARTWSRNLAGDASEAVWARYARGCVEPSRVCGGAGLLERVRISRTRSETRYNLVFHESAARLPPAPVRRWLSAAARRAAARRQARAGGASGIDDVSDASGRRRLDARQLSDLQDEPRAGQARERLDLPRARRGRRGSRGRLSHRSPRSDSGDDGRDVHLRRASGDQSDRARQLPGRQADDQDAHASPARQSQSAVRRPVLHGARQHASSRGRVPPRAAVPFVSVRRLRPAASGRSNEGGEGSRGDEGNLRHRDAHDQGDRGLSARPGGPRLPGGAGRHRRASGATDREGQVQERRAGISLRFHVHRAVEETGAAAVDVFGCPESRAAAGGRPERSRQAGPPSRSHRVGGCHPRARGDARRHAVRHQVRRPPSIPAWCRCRFPTRCRKSSRS